MIESPDARAALLRFHETFTAATPGDLESFDRVFSCEPSLLIIGTAFHEWVEGREQGARAWGTEGVSLEAGDPIAWEHGTVAWAADRPTFVLGDARIPIRILAVLLEEEGAYKIVTAHFSVGVPDDVAGEKAVAWSRTTPAH